MRSFPVVREALVRVGTYADEVRRRQWLRIVEISAGGRRRCRVDLTVGVPATWSLSIDGFASLDEASAYVERTTPRVAWLEGVALADRLVPADADRFVAWYVGEPRPSAPTVDVDLDDVVDADRIEVVVEPDDFEPTGRAA